MSNKSRCRACNHQRGQRSVANMAKANKGGTGSGQGRPHDVQPKKAPCVCKCHGSLVGQELAPRRSAHTPATANGLPAAFVASGSTPAPSVAAREVEEQANGGGWGMQLTTATPASTKSGGAGESPILTMASATLESPPPDRTVYS